MLLWEIENRQGILNQSIDIFMLFTSTWTVSVAYFSAGYYSVYFSRNRKKYFSEILTQFHMTVYVDNLPSAAQFIRKKIGGKDIEMYVLETFHFTNFRWSS